MTSIFKEESGQSMVEYGLILALISIIVMGSLVLLGDSIDGIYTYINGQIFEVLKK